MKKTILFVDDEPVLLDLYAAIFDGMRNEWDLHFANSGPGALEFLERTPCDVIITDMRMPGMNGAQLLREVAHRHPRTARLILSGFAEQQTVADCVGSTHQYLSKPCDMEILKLTLARVCALDVWLTDDKLKKLVSELGALPSLPSLHFRILEALDSPSCTAEQVGEIVASDMGMTAKMLQLVNSAFFGMACKISSPVEAVQFLGVGTVRSLALSLHLFSCFDSTKIKDFSLERLWQHAMRTGRMAKNIAQLEKSDIAVVDEAFVAGLLHDIGKLMLASSLPSQYAKALSLAQANRIPIDIAETEVFGANHAQVGAYLLGLWGLPVQIVEAIALHHYPGRALLKQFGPLAAVHVANALDPERGPEPGIPPVVDEEYLHSLGLEHRLDYWRKAMPAREETEACAAY
jgi:putative nucleotidyltransferase with HDIG domain